MTQEQLAILSIVIASLGFIISLITLYFSHVMPPKIQTTIGPYIKIYHSDFNIGVSTGIYMPMSFFNRSTRATVVEKTAIEIYKKSEDHNRFFIHWKAFSSFNVEKNKWKWNEIAHALPVLGKSSIQKTVWFFWSAQNTNKLLLKEGIYCLDFLYWLNKKKKPIREHHEIIIDTRTAQIMNDYMQSERSTTLDITIDKEMEQNRLLSAHESIKLLG